MKKIKIFISILILLTIFFTFVLSTFCYANQDMGLGNLKNYKGSASSSKGLTSRVGKILGVIKVIGTVVSVATLMVIGIKYMIGSVEEKAEYKKTLVPYIIGAGILFSGTLLPELIYKFSQNI